MRWGVIRKPRARSWEAYSEVQDIGTLIASFCNKYLLVYNRREILTRTDVLLIHDDSTPLLLTPSSLKWYFGEDFVQHDFKAEILTKSSSVSHSDNAANE